MYLAVDIEGVIKIVQTKIPNSSVGPDTIIECINEVCEAVRIYCNREDIPARLKYALANIARS